MNISYTWRNTEKTDAVEELTSKKLTKLERHFDKALSIHVTFDMPNKQLHQAKATLHVPGSEINACSEDKDMYKAIDSLITKLLRQVDEYKQKMKEHRD
jgi:putative sigma-54 modulation protein